MSTNELMSPEDKSFLELSQRTRRQIIAEQTKNGKLPECQEDRDFLFKALDGGDRQVLAKAKIKSDDSNGKAQQAAAAMVAEMLLKVHSRPDANTPRKEPLVLPPVDLQLVPGETHIGVQTFQLNDIMNPKA